ncbi:MAG: hypothetical protein RL318_2639 [Fibrobacterota bacterium]|jgi:molybdopterin converting factor small subunit
MNLSIAWFSILREQAGCSEESVETSAITASELYGQMRAKHRFTLAQGSLRVAINDEFAQWDDRLAPGDRVVFIAPVGGG